jgi:hypothetical protein
MRATPERIAWRLVAACVALGLGLQLRLLFTLNVNWDEFYYLGGIHDFLRGELARPLQSFHVRLLGWIARLPGDEIFQILIGRLAAFAAEVGALAGVYVLTRRFTRPLDAALAVLLLLSTGYVLQHGFSFRTDPFVVCLGVGSIVLALPSTRAPRAAVATSGALFAVAVLFSLKAVLLSVPLLAALWNDESPRRLARVALFGATAAAAFGALYLGHAAGLASAGVASSAPDVLAASARMQLLPRTLPGWQFLPISLRQSPLTWLCLLGGVLSLLPTLRRRADRGRSLMLLALAFPLTTFLYYRNTFPYFYLFALAPSIVLAGAFSERLSRRAAALWSPAAIAVPLTLAALAASSLVVHASRLSGDGIAPQRELVGVVHQLFPEPVPYIDRCSMIASFPQAGFFMTGWGIEAYYERGVPVLRDAVSQRSPPLLIANSPGLAIHLPEDRARRMPYALLPEDRRALRENYVHHWGLLWVAGKEVVLAPEQQSAEFDIVIAGRYTLEADGAVAVDGVVRVPGEAFELARGTHRGAPVSGIRAFRLRWGDRLPRPTAPPSTEPLFRGF